MPELSFAVMDVTVISSEPGFGGIYGIDRIFV